ncbi:MGA_1079 family surface serine endopeptidase [Mycoplasma aquilae ATCC BAA-1896]|uniref:MGA_1079 family surface serine endopeptidase n=1 Tax=Mycoplasma aquilae TaxID=1312741 RepID=UPI003A8A13DA
MKKKTLLKNIILLTPISALDFLASSCHDDNKVSVADQYDTKIQELKQNIEAEISVNTFFVHNNLVSVTDLNNLIAQLDSALAQKNISQEQYQAFVTSKTSLLEQFQANCAKAKSELINSVKQLVAKLSTLNSYTVGIELLNQVTLALKQAGNDIEQDNLPALLQDKTQLSSLLNQVVQASNSQTHVEINSLIGQINSALEINKLYVSNALVSANSLNGLKEQLNNLLQNMNITTQEIDAQTKAVTQAIANFNQECTNALNALINQVHTLVEKLTSIENSLLSPALASQISSSLASAKENIQTKNLGLLLENKSTLSNLLKQASVSQNQALISNYQNLISSLNTILNQNQALISNNLVNPQPINMLIVQLNSAINQNNVTQAGFNQIKQAAQQAIDNFNQACQNALTNTVSSLQAKIDLFTPQVIEQCKKATQEQINSAILNAKSNIASKDVAAMLSDLTQLNSLYTQALKEGKDSQSQVNLLKQEMNNFKLKVANYQTQYQDYPELVTLLPNISNLLENLNSETLQQVTKEFQKAQSTLAAWEKEANIINFDSTFKAWLKAHPDVNNNLLQLANSIISSFENNFKQGYILSSSQIEEVKTSFNLNVNEFYKQYAQSVNNNYKTLYTQVSSLISRLLALPSTKDDATKYQTKLLVTPDSYNTLAPENKAQVQKSVANLLDEILQAYPLNVIQLKEDGQKAINLVLNPKTTAINNGYDLNVNSASINSSNFNLYLQENNQDKKINILSKDFGLNPDNFDLLQVKYNLTSQDVSTYILKNVTFDFKLSTRINQINYANIDDLYNVNYSALGQWYEEDFSKDVNKNFGALLSAKYQKLEQYFTYELQPNSIQLSQGKFSLNVVIKHKDLTIKTLTLTSKQAFSFKNPLSRKVRVSLNGSLTNNPNFKNNNSNNLLYAIAQLFQSQIYRQDPNSTTGFDPSDWTYVSNLMSTANLPDRYSSINNPQKFNLLQNTLRVAANISLEGYDKWELVNYSNSNIFIYNDRNHTATFKIKFTGKNKQPFIYDLNIQTKTGQQYYEANKEIFQLSDYLKKTSEILKQATVINPKVTHSNFYAAEGVKKLNDLYTLPKFGKYQIVFNVFNPHDYSVNNVEGYVELQYAVTLNGKVVNDNRLKSPKFKFYYFRPLVYTDIKPSNNKAWFTSEDFKSQGSNQTVKNQVALINSHNFEYRTLFGKRVFDADTLMEEQAFDKLNYLFKFKGEKASVENNDKFDNKDYDEKDKGPSAPSTPNTNDISNPDDQPHTVDPNSLLGSYFVYYYDVKASFNHRYRTSAMTFKVGFINKWNWNDRYTTGEITLRNLKNDFADEFFPDIILNKITNNQIIISGIDTITASQFASEIKSSTPHYWSLNISAPSYKKYLLYPGQFSISDVKMIDDKNGRAMIRLAYQQKPQFGNREYIGEAWYEISGFKTIPNAPEVSYSDDQLLALPFKQKMKKIFRANGDVLRQRVNEITANDNYWLLNKNTGKVEYTLPNKYFKPILGQSNKQAYVNVHLSANVKFLDSISYARVFSYTNGKLGGINLSFNYNDLIKNGSVVIKQRTEKIQPKGTITPFQIDYTMTVTLNEEGMHFEFGLDDPKYKITQDNPVTSLFKQPELTIPNNLQNTFNPNQAFFFDYFAGDISYQYTNNIAEEDFGTNNSTNVISYKNMDYTQENMPIVLSNKDSFNDPFKYNPNQMLSYKLQDGYKFNNEYLNRSYVATSPIAQDLMSRSFAMNYGSGMMVAKVNSDPNDGRFYALTNHHVINNDAKNWTPEKITFDAGTSPTIAGLDFGNNVNAGFSYWNGLYNQGTKVQVVWSGINQVGYSSQIDWNTGMFKTGVLDKNRFFDVTLIIFDVNPLIKQLKAEGKFQTAMWYQNWFNLKNLTFSSFLDKQSVNRDKNIHHSLFNGFPYGKQSSYIIHRNESGYETDSFKKQTPYEPTYYNAGNSGTGVMNNLGEYVTTINSGGPLWLLVGKNGAFDSGLYSYNFYGVNEKDQNPLDLINYHSMARNIMRLNAFNPDVYDIPWFFKNWNK